MKMIKYCNRATLLVFKNAPIAYLLLGIVKTASAISVPLFLVSFELFLDGIIGASSYVLFYLGIMFFAILLEASSHLLEDLLRSKMLQTFTYNMSMKMMDKYRNVKFSTLEEKKHQDVVQKMNNNPVHKIFSLAEQSLGTLTSFFTMICTSFILVRVNWYLPVIFLLLAFYRIYLDFLSISKMNTMFCNQSEQERMMQYLRSVLGDKDSLFELKIFRSIPFLLNKYKKIAQSVIQERIATTLKSQKYYIFSTIATVAMAIFTFYTIIHAAIIGSISIGLLTSLLGTFCTLIDKSTDMSYYISEMSRNFIYMIYYEQFMQLEECSNTNCGEEIEKIPHLPIVEFQNVSFHYPDQETYALDDVSFQMNGNERIALVGVNGSGKSTIAKLLCGLYAPQKGRILLFGRDISTISQQQLQQFLSVIFQDFIGYQFSLRENVALGDIRQLNQDDLLKSAISACDDDKLATYALDQPLGTMDEGAINLSKGQWQKVVIARTVAANHPFLIIDEPTASLDPISESKIYETFSQISKGKVCEMGTHGELMERGGHYRTMYLEQSKWYQ